MISSVSTIDFVVMLAGLGLTVFIGWFFLGKKRPAVVSARANGKAQPIEIEVIGGYTPSVIRLIKDRPARLIFDRQETSSCSEEVVLPDFKIRKKLPAFQKTSIEFTPDQSGEFEFSCGMGMLHGKIVVQ